VGGGTHARASAEFFVIRMKFTEIIAIVAAISSGGCLASIQIRKIVKGEMSFLGTESLREFAKIKLDKFDKRMAIVSGISFLVCIIFAFISY
jgi:hypothetical protein